MNRVSVRGIGLAAAVVAAGSLAAGTTATASPAETAGASPLFFDVSIDPSSPTDNAALALDQLRAAHRSGIEAQPARLAHVARLRVAAARAAAARVAAAQATNAASQRALARQSASRAYIRTLTPGSARALGAKMVAARGWSAAEFVCVDNMWTRESNWRVHALNHSSGAYGIPQAQPGLKMASAGGDWRDDAATQIAWGLSYIAHAYASPCQAWSFWQTHHWY